MKIKVIITLSVWLSLFCYAFGQNDINLENVIREACANTTQNDFANCRFETVVEDYVYFLNENNWSFVVRRDQFVTGDFTSAVEKDLILGVGRENGAPAAWWLLSKVDSNWQFIQFLFASWSTPLILSGDGHNDILIARSGYLAPIGDYYPLKIFALRWHDGEVRKEMLLEFEAFATAFSADCAFANPDESEFFLGDWSTPNLRLEDINGDNLLDLILEVTYKRWSFEERPEKVQSRACHELASTLPEQSKEVVFINRGSSFQSTDSVDWLIDITKGDAKK